MSASRIRAALWRWVDAGTQAAHPSADAERIDWPRVAPFLALHLACFAALWTGASAVAGAVAAALFALRMFAITAFYHRYFSHRAFRTSRATQFAFAILAASAAQRGPLWWASHHRHHHAHADGDADSHSSRRGFLWSHVGWFLARSNFAARLERVPDLAGYPELRWLDRFDVAVPALLAVALYALGAALESVAPSLGTTGAQMVVWGFCISTVALYHATFTINSLAHRYGTRRYETQDASRNNVWLALLTFGEGWHNNHHRFPGAARQGLRWWEIDVTYYGLVALAALGVIRDLRAPPAEALGGGR